MRSQRIAQDNRDVNSPKSAAEEGTLILGIGNILLRDEGVGVRVIEAMADLTLPADISLLDGGTYGIDLIDDISGKRKVIVVDAADGGSEPGTVYRISADELFEKTEGSISLHEFGLFEVLRTARCLGCAPREVIIFGVQPKEVCLSLELSDEVKAAVPQVIERVLAEIHGS